MRSNSGHGKSNNNLNDPTMKEDDQRSNERPEFDRGDREHAEQGRRPDRR